MAPVASGRRRKPSEAAGSNRWTVFTMHAVEFYGNDREREREREQRAKDRAAAAAAAGAIALSHHFLRCIR